MSRRRKGQNKPDILVYSSVLLIVDIVESSVNVFSLGKAYESGNYSCYDIFQGEMLISYSTPTSIPEYFVVPATDLPEEKKQLPSLGGAAGKRISNLRDFPNSSSCYFVAKSNLESTEYNKFAG